MRRFYRLLFMLLPFCLGACSSTLNVKDPVKAYKSTRVFQMKDGLFVAGDWDYIDIARAADPPRWVTGGLAARIVRGKVTYEHFCVTQPGHGQAGDVQLTPEDMDYDVKKHFYDRNTLERAARGAGLVVPLPYLKRNQSQSFSPAYVRGFLLKVDRAAMLPWAQGVKPKAVQAARKKP